jgi:hypothetical protein
MVLFTIILDFDGGTYVSQVSSISVGATLPEWIRGLKQPESLGLDGRQAMAVAKVFEIHERELAALRDTINVWCTTALVGEKLAVLNIVATVPQPVEKKETRETRGRTASARRNPPQR